MAISFLAAKARPRQLVKGNIFMIAATQDQWLSRKSRMGPDAMAAFA